MNDTLPFYGNPDESHCFQAVVRMLLKHWFPEDEYTWEELEVMTGKKPGMWTWPMRGLVELRKRGIDVVNWREFDYHAFVGSGAEYLREVYGEDKVKIQLEHCDLDYEIQNARELLDEIPTKQGLPNLTDIKQLIEDGYLVVCNLNLKRLNQQAGYTGHFVLIYDISEIELFMHDPGPPHRARRAVSYDQFLAAWQYPDETQRNLMAFRM